MLKMVAALLMATTLTTACGTAEVHATNSEVNIPSDQIIIEEKTIIKHEPVVLEDNFLVYVETNDMIQLENYINEAKERMEHAENMLEAAQGCGYSAEHPIIELARREYEQAEMCYNRYLQKYNQFHTAVSSNKYPAAATVWNYLKDLGYNDYVCAGIIGNLMSEVGGQTLDLQYWLRNDKYAGMCQWSLRYFPNVPTDILGQCDLLRDTIEENFNIFGFNYMAGFTYEDFLNIQSVEEAAVAYEKCYGRGGIKDHSRRIQNAYIAYDYFVN